MSRSERSSVRTKSTPAIRWVTRHVTDPPRRRARPRVLAIHGFDGYAAKRAEELTTLCSSLEGRRVASVAYYTGDVGFDLSLVGLDATTDTSIDTIGAALRDLIASLDDSPVDLVGHSMGGLIVQKALQLFEPAFVRRVVMLGVPFGGLPSAAGADVAQCREMSPGSAWLAETAARGWRADLVIASEADEAVPLGSALAARVGREVVLPRELGIHHGDLLEDASVLARVRRALR